MHHFSSVVILYWLQMRVYFFLQAFLNIGFFTGSLNVNYYHMLSHLKICWQLMILLHALAAFCLFVFVAYCTLHWTLMTRAPSRHQETASASYSCSVIYTVHVPVQTIISKKAVSKENLSYYCFLAVLGYIFCITFLNGVLDFHQSQKIIFNGLSNKVKLSI